MGLIAAVIRKQYLIAYRHELEYKVMLITQAKMNMTKSVEDLLNVGTDTDPDDPVVKQLEQRKARLNLLEKQLDLAMNKYQGKLAAVEKEIESCSGMIENNMKTAFSYGK